MAWFDLVRLIVEQFVVITISQILILYSYLNGVIMHNVFCHDPWPGVAMQCVRN
jgi:hypothetical protein